MKSTENVLVKNEKWLTKLNNFKKWLERLSKNFKLVEKEIEEIVVEVASDELRDPKYYEYPEELKVIVEKAILIFIHYLKHNADEFRREYLVYASLEAFEKLIQPLYELIFKIFEEIYYNLIEYLYFKNSKLEEETQPSLNNDKIKKYFVKVWLETLEEKNSTNSFPLDILIFPDVVEKFCDDHYDDFDDFALQNWRDDNRKI